jgi:ribosomal-protein-alanine N-acetyltransferase
LNFAFESEKYLIIRAATPADLADIISLERKSPLAAHWSESQYSRAFSGDSPRRLILVAADEKPKQPDQSKQAPERTIIGFVVVRILAQEWEIENIVVDVKEQRRGTATKLLHEIRSLAGSENAMKILLEVRASNVPARSFYEKIGFQGCGYRRRYYTAPIEDAVAYVYVMQQLTRED